MKITIIANSLDSEGPEAGLSGLASHLTARGWKVSAILTGAPEQGTFLSHRFCCRNFGLISAADVLLIHSGIPIKALAALLFSMPIVGGGSHRRMIFMIDRLPPDQAASSCNQPALALASHSFSRSIIGMTLRRADAVVIAGEDMRQMLTRRYGTYVCADKVRVVRPWSEGHSLPTFDRADHPLTHQLGLNGAFTVMHHGFLGDGHDVCALAQAIELTSTDASTLWIFCGDGPRPEQLHRKRDELNALRNVRYVPPQIKCPASQLIHLADAHVLSQAAHLTGAVAPLRLPQILAAAKPLITVAPDGADCSCIVRETNAGVAVPSGRGEVLARSVWQLRDSVVQRNVLGRSARLVFEKTMSARLAYPRIERILAGQENA